MSPPIYTPDGNEVTKIVLPDGSTASEVVAPDGSVVFDAGPEIPDSGVARYTMEQTLADDWNENGLQEDGATAGYTTTSQEGTYALTSNENGYPKFRTADASIWDAVETDNELTICGWFKNDNADQNYSAAVSTGRDSANNEVQFQLNPDSSGLGTRFRTPWGTPNDSSLHSTGSWIFAAGRIKASVVDIRVGTTTLDSVSVSGTPISGLDTPLVLAGQGGSSGVGITWDGDWDDVRVYSRYVPNSELDDIRAGLA